MHHKRLTAILLTALLCVQTTAPAMAAEVETVQDQVAAEASSDGGISEEDAALAVSFARGVPGKAMEMGKSSPC